MFGEIPEPQYLSFLLIVFYRTERLATIFVFIPQGTNFSIVIAFDIYSSMMQMSRAWMYGDRRSAAYREGVRSFRLAAEANKRRDRFMTCPCVECRNEKDHSSSRVIQSHLL